MIELIVRNNLSALFHFTSVQNLPAIARAGRLCSKQVLDELGVWPCPDPGGNQLSHNLDRERGNWDKVSLSYTPYTPMSYRRKPEKHLCYFVLKPEVLCFDKVLFTNMNATANGHVRAEGLEGLHQVYFDEVTSSPRGWDRDWLNKAQAEILVPHFVPLDFVTHIGFVSQASLDYGCRLWNAEDRPECLVKPKYFAHDPRHSTPAIPYLEGAILSKKSIMEVQEDIDALQATPPDSIFSRFRDATVTVKALVQASAGSKVYARIYGTGAKSDEITFSMRQRSAVIFSFSIGYLSVGTHNIDLYIEAYTPILWARIPFEVVE